MGSCRGGRFALLAIVFLGLAFLTTAQDKRFTFNTGLVYDSIGDCAGTELATSGYQFFAYLLNGSRPMYINSLDGKYRIYMNLMTRLDKCNSTVHVDQWNDLIQNHGVVLGFGSGASGMATTTGRLLSEVYHRLIFHCCVGPDSVYQLDYKYMFGIQCSNTKYPIQALRAMALQGKVTRLAIIGRNDVPFLQTTCDAATVQINTLQSIVPNFTIVYSKVYNTTQAGLPGFLEGTIAEAMTRQPDAFFGCEWGPGGEVIVNTFLAANYYLKALWLTFGPTTQVFIDDIKGNATNVMSAAQWHPAVTTTDPFFGPSASYTRDLYNWAQVNATYVASGASATGYVYALAIQTAFANCDLSQTKGDINQLLFNASAIRCNPQYWQDPSTLSTPQTGYELLRMALAATNVDTMFGAVQFNQFRRNIKKDPVTTQILNSVIQAVLPIDIANAALVMPIAPPSPPPSPPPPPPPPFPASEGSGLSSTQVKNVVVGVVVGVVGGLLVLGALGLILYPLINNRRSQHRSLLTGYVRPPGAGPDTTIVVTDIQSSTDLWESLPAGVMDATISLHHSCLRTVLDKHSGYESGTEGDSLIIAFHTPQSAVAFGAEAQVALMACPWPNEVLATPLCAPVYVKVAPGFINKSNSPSGLGSPGAKAKLAKVRSRIVRANSDGGGRNNFFERGMQSSGSLQRWMSNGYSAEADDEDGVILSGGHMLPGLTALSEHAEHEAVSTPGAPDKGATDTDSDKAQRSAGSHPGQIRITMLPAPSLSPAPTQESPLSSSQFQISAPPASSQFPIAPPTSSAFSLFQARPPSSGGAPAYPRAPANSEHQTLGISEVRASLEVASGVRSPFEDAGSHNGDTTPRSSNNMPWGALGEPQGTMHPNVVSQSLAQGMQTAASGSSDAVLLWRGPRVRIGMHCGIHNPSDIISTLGRVRFTGHPMAMAKAVSDAGQGGMVLLSHDTFLRCNLETLQDVRIFHMGEHQLPEVGKVVLYGAAKLDLVSRFGQMGPLRSVRQVAPSFLDAPFGRISVVFMHASGTLSLRAYNAELADRALQLYENVGQACLRDAAGGCGYMVEHDNGLLLAAFNSPGPALRWALATIRACLAAPWDQALLEHELGEEVAVRAYGQGAAQQMSMLSSMTMAGPTGSASALSLLSKSKTSNVVKKIVLFRGLRLKAGVDIGAAITDIQRPTGRITYRGKVMNRAARISNAAAKGSVWCSAATWIRAMPTINLKPQPSAATAGDGVVSSSSVGRPSRDTEDGRSSLPQGDGRSSLPQVDGRPSVAASVAISVHPADDATAAAGACEAAPAEEVTALSLGPQKLKGIGEMVLLEVKYVSDLVDQSKHPTWT